MVREGMVKMYKGLGGTTRSMYIEAAACRPRDGVTKTRWSCVRREKKSKLSLGRKITEYP